MKQWKFSGLIINYYYEVVNNICVGLLIVSNETPLVNGYRPLIDFCPYVIFCWRLIDFFALL
jgi:hypothetical protein